MVTFEITLNPLIASAIVLFSAWIGFMLKKRLIARDRNQINYYEKEMMLNHAEILDLQKDYINLEMKMRELTTPVIPINTALKDNAQEAENAAIDASLRKKLLSKDLSKEKLSKETAF
jgi:hypothetical protein